ENPARWKGNLAFVLEKRTAVRRVTHFRAMPIDEVPSFMTNLRKQSSIGARAFEFLILTATRTSETIGARWNEIDLEQKVWTIPAERMKARRKFQVPLSDRCLSILREMQALSDGTFVFP